MRLFTLAFVACWFMFGGGGGCDPTPPPSTCPGDNPIVANPSTTTYNLTNKGLNAEGVLWSPSTYDPDQTIVRLDGSGDACVYKGGLVGLVPFTAVFECDSENCPGGVCPDPCFSYHTYKAIRNWRTTGSRTLYQGVCARDTGDGIAAGENGRGTVTDVWNSYFDNIHDDALEQDWGCTMIMRNSLVERGFMMLAMNPRQDEPVDLTNCTIQSYGNLFRLFKFPNTYKQKGPGGITKTPDGPYPKMIMKDTTVVIDAPHGNDQEIVPSPSRFVNPGDCSNNTYYFNGTAAQYATFLADKDGVDALTNGERLNQLGTSCINVITRPEGWTSFDFLFNYWFPLVDSWKAANTADNGC